MYIMHGRIPKTCLDCPCVHFGQNGAWDYCQAKAVSGDYDRYAFESHKLTERPKWCPIEEKQPVCRPEK